jgi:hypothetical protein
MKASFNARALPSRSRDLTLYGKNVQAPEAAAAASGHSRTRVGAPVASQRCRILRSGRDSIGQTRKKVRKGLRENTQAEYK